MNEHSLYNNKSKANYIKVAADSLVFCWRAHPPLFIGFMMISALLCAVQAGEVFAMRWLFDAAAEYFAGRISIADVAAAGVPMAVLLVAFPFVNIFAWLGQGYFWRRGSGYLMARYHESVQRVPLIDFEKPETFDRMEKAWLGSESAPSASRSVIQSVFYFIPYLLFTAIFLVSIKPALLVSLLIIFASVMLAQVLRAGVIRRFLEQNAGLRRQTEYLENSITGKEYAKETRTLGAGSYFFGLYADSMKRLNTATIKTERKIAFVELLLRSANVLGYAGILVMLVYYMAEGSISVGAFASVFFSLERMNSLLRDTVDYIGEMLKEIVSASFTHEFISMPEEEGSRAPLGKKAEINLDGVSFAYPGAGGNALSDIRLSIKRGETLAVVGENGAGKTTLVNVIIGLYNPSSGTVCYGGENIGGYVSKSRFDRLSGVFQNFMRYKLSAKENITISDVGASGDNDGNMARAASEAGVHLSELRGGPDTMLSRDFGGIELSGGQWQRVAIARGLYRRHDVVVLDEPTAAIDPIEESSIFRLFKESARGKTAILVTHRLGSTKIADRILLLDGGRISELGTHGQLMAQNGKYAHMYREQASWYDR